MNRATARRRCRAVGIGLLIASLSLTTGALAAAPFRIIHFPDTQSYDTHLRGATPEMWDEDVTWITNNVQAMNIQFVVHTGDIEINDNKSLAESEKRQRHFLPMDGVVPYAIALGNHDGCEKACAGHPRNGTLNFNQLFPLDKYEVLPSFGGYLDEPDNGGPMDNTYHFFSAGGVDWLILAVEYGPHHETMTWAEQVIAGHPNRKVILLYHGWLGDFGEISDGEAQEKYGRENGAIEMWNGFVKKYANVFMVLCGHTWQIDRRVEQGDNGNNVYMLMADLCPEEYAGGGGYVRILTFHPDQDKFTAEIYSPYFENHPDPAHPAYLTGSDNQFEYTNLGIFSPGDVRIDSFTASPSTITEGQPSTVSWTTSNATSVTLDGASVNADGSQTVSPANTTTYTLVAQGTGGPVTRTVEVTVTVVQTVSVPFRMNCGVNSYTPPGWAEDDAYVSGGEDFDNWPNAISTTGVPNAAPTAVYETVRHVGPHTYTIPIADGSYVVRMHFCEGYSATSTRDVKYVIEGVTVEDHMDYATEAGAHFKAVAKDYDVSVTDGDIVIECTDYSSDVFEAGIEVLAGGGTPTITLVQPNGGEVWYVGATASIKWTVAGVGDVAISYWSGANGSWQEIAPTVKVSDAEWGSYPWTVPDAPSTDCRVSISDYNMVAAAAQSAAPFEIRSVTDSDSDGMDDGWETQHFGDLSHDGTADTDGDGLTDYQEFMQGTNPLVSDSGDGGGGGGFGCLPVSMLGLVGGGVALALFGFLTALLSRRTAGRAH